MSYSIKFHKSCLPPNRITEGRLERYEKYLSLNKKYEDQLFLNVSGECFFYQTKNNVRFNKYDICMHSGLNGACPKGHPKYNPDDAFGRCHNSERVRFGSYNPRYEKFLDPCSTDRVRYICEAQNMPLSEEYSLKQEGKIIFCLNSSDGWYPNLFNPRKVGIIKGYEQEIKNHTDKDVLVRLHPKDASRMGSYWKEIFEGHGLKIFNGTHKEFLEQVGCLVVDHTTMVFEAAVRGIPVFYLGEEPKSCVGNDYFLKNYKLFDFDNIIAEKLPDRLSYLRKYFSGLLLLQELEDGMLFEYIDKYLTKYSNV